MSMNFMMTSDGRQKFLYHGFAYAIDSPRCIVCGGFVVLVDLELLTTKKLVRGYEVAVDKTKLEGVACEVTCISASNDAEATGPPEPCASSRSTILAKIFVWESLRKKGWLDEFLYGLYEE